MLHRDWKKLTFYYFADAYINFNSLVTDLFKVYKTRIWMSAINAASFASPSLGLQAPSGIGPGAVGVNRPAQAERRTQPQDQPPYNNVAQGSRGYPASHAGTFTNTLDRNPVPPTSFQQPSFTYGYPTFTAVPRGVGVSIGGYTPNMLPQIDSFSTFAAPAPYQSMPARFPSPHGIAMSSDMNEFNRQGNGHPPGSEAWMNSFQSLSLNTH
jgi:PSP1 C-terminal conserved region